MKPILCLDFDGVIHSYTSGWKDIDIIPDPPVPGAFAFILSALDHFRVAVYSSRSITPRGRNAMQAWFRIYQFDPDLLDWPDCKPSAFITIDDRAITFTGPPWPDPAALLNFKPWNK